MAKKKPYQYGDPAPNNWRECSDALKSIPGKKSTKKHPMEDKLDTIAQLLKDHK